MPRFLDAAHCLAPPARPLPEQRRRCRGHIARLGHLRASPFASKRRAVLRLLYLAEGRRGGASRRWPRLVKPPMPLDTPMPSRRLRIGRAALSISLMMPLPPRRPAPNARAAQRRRRYRRQFSPRARAATLPGERR